MKFSETVNRIKNETHLDSARKSEIRKRLMHMIDAGSVRAGDLERQHIMQRSSAVNYSIKRIKFMPIYAVLMVMALVGGGVSASAQTALPGDALYPVKLGFNEKVGAALRVSADSKANYEMELMERRLEETGKVAANGELSGEVKASIEENFELHAERVEERIAAFEAKENFTSAADVAVKFQTSLEAHEQILEKLSESGTSAAPTADIAGSVRARAKAAETSRISLEDRIFRTDIDGEISEERIMAYAEQIRLEALSGIRYAAEYIEDKRAKLSDDVVLKAQNDLRAAKHLSEEGSAKIAAKSYREAVNLFQQSRQIAQETMVFLKAHLEISADRAIDLGTEFRTKVIAPIEVTPRPLPRESIDGETKIEFDIKGEEGGFFLDTRTVVDPTMGEGKTSDGTEVRPMPTPVDPELRADVKGTLEGATKIEL